MSLQRKKKTAINYAQWLFSIYSVPTVSWTQHIAVGDKSMPLRIEAQLHIWKSTWGRTSIQLPFNFLFKGSSGHMVGLFLILSEICWLYGVHGLSLPFTFMSFNPSDAFYWPHPGFLTSGPKVPFLLLLKLFWLRLRYLLGLDPG